MDDTSLKNFVASNRKFEETRRFPKPVRTRSAIINKLCKIHKDMFNNYQSFFV